MSSSSEVPSATAMVVSKNGSLLLDIDNMKVPELKKRLKSLGLPTSGNKADLVERLQEAYLSEKDGSLDGTLDDDSLEEALLNDDAEQSAIPETATATEEFTFSSPEKELPKIAESNASKPLKKRVVAQTPVVESPKASKIVIKRGNYPIIEEPATTVKKDHPLIEAPKSDDVAEDTKILSAAERLQLRAKRFNVDSKSSSVTSNTKIAPKVTAPVEKVGSISVSAVASAKGSPLDVLRKRAERFGENVSTVMKKLENQERLLKRKLKFTGGSVQTVSSTNKPLGGEQDKKKQRLERFGLVK